MATVRKWILNLILALGILFVFGGFFLLVYAVIGDYQKYFRFWPFFVVFVGMVLIYSSVVLFHWLYEFFTGLSLSLSGCFSLLITTEIIPSSFDRLWPVFTIITGVSLALSCVYKFRRLRPSYFVPALVIVALGIFFLMFSLEIISMSISSFFVIVGPFLLFAAGAASIIFFIFQSNHKEFVIPEEDADSLD